MKWYHLILFLLVLPASLLAQKYQVDSAYLVAPTVLDGDTLPNVQIKEIRIFPKPEFKNRRAYRRYNRLVRNVKAAYPFALIARKELGIMNDSLQHIEGERARKKYIKEYERNMFSEYEDELRSLTFSQGRILLKLVYRELGNTSYELVREYRGAFSAMFWQGIARLFGSNLKSTYDPYGEDAQIEMIIQMIEAGVI